MNIYGTLGPACVEKDILIRMFQNGMTGVRLNLSHMTLKEAAPMLSVYQEAAAAAGTAKPGLLIDMQGPELRIGLLPEPLLLKEGDTICLGRDIPVPEFLLSFLEKDQELLLDDGKLLLRVTAAPSCLVVRGGTLNSRKSIAIPGKQIPVPTLTEHDLKNLRDARTFGVTAVMQPFVRSRRDLQELRSAMENAGCGDLPILAKIENLEGVKQLEEFLPYAEEIVIARGDLGNAVPLWELPSLQKKISRICQRAGMPFMVVTQMLSSMEERPVPTRAEVSDIYNAVLDGAASVMVTGETAIGKYPEEVIRYLANTAREALKDRGEEALL